MTRVLGLSMRSLFRVALAGKYLGSVREVSGTCIVVIAVIVVIIGVIAVIVDVLVICLTVVIVNVGVISFIIGSLCQW